MADTLYWAFGALSGGLIDFVLGLIGGEFLIVPALLAATNMPMINAVGTRLVAVSAFGLTTAANYALSGLVDWWLAGIFVAGGLIGSVTGSALPRRLSSTGVLRRIFASIVFVVASYMIWQGWSALSAR